MPTIINGKLLIIMKTTPMGGKIDLENAIEVTDTHPKYQQWMDIAPVISDARDIK
jgi:hypothetical protein